MRVGIGDAERLKVSRRPPHPSGLRPCPPTPSGLQPSPPDRGSRPSPLWGEGFCAAQIGGDWSFCGTFGYIYWEFGRSAPVWGAGGPVCRSYGAPIHTGLDSAPSSAPFGGTFPPRGRFMERTLCAPTAFLRTALHIERGTGLEPVP